MQITISDESLTGVQNNAFKIDLLEEEMTVRDLITERVIQEVSRYNQVVTDKFFGLVQPSAQEKLLNPSGGKASRQIDPEQQVYVALDAFQKQQYFILIDNEQVIDLDYVFTPKANMQVSFIKLVALVGG